MLSYEFTELGCINFEILSNAFRYLTPGFVPKHCLTSINLLTHAELQTEAETVLFPLKFDAQKVTGTSLWTLGMISL